MTKPAIPLFLNPTAGRGRAGKTGAALSSLLTGNGIEHTVVESTAPGEIEARVRAAVEAGAERVLVAGGDGSVHEAVNGIFLSGRMAELGVVPIGTGNDFAKASTIPLHWEDAAILLADRLRSDMAARNVDVGRMNGRYFANSAGIGFDARVTEIAQKSRLPIGDLVYLVAILKVLRSRVSTPSLDIRFDEVAIDGPVTLVSVSNGAWVGGMFQIAPGAINDDGELDLVIVDPVSRLRILRLLPKLMNGSHLDEPEMHCHRISDCDIVAAAPVPSHLDGEIQPLQTHFKVELQAGALPLL
jgi:diacylglycerol kinase (ATP)